MFYYHEGGDLYYGYTSVRIEYDKTFSVDVFEKSGDSFVEKTDYLNSEIGIYKQIFFEANYDNSGKILEYRVDIYPDGENKELSYHVIIDTRVSSVALRDNTGEQRSILQPFFNRDYFDDDVRSNQSGSGVMNLQWNRFEENDYFT